MEPSISKNFTTEKEYTDRLIKLQNTWWKKFFNVQLPYKWNLNRINPGFTLEIGCGLGRNLAHLRGNGVGIDHNNHSVEFAKNIGLDAFTVKGFYQSNFSIGTQFDSLLLSHVAEHMTLSKVKEIILQYKRHLKPNGQLILITPQERGFNSDNSHIEFMDFDKLNMVGNMCGFSQRKAFSFPLPRFMGKLFIYNEFVYIGSLV